jgi:WD40 repeat protein
MRKNRIYINPEDSFESSPNFRCKDSLIKDNYDDYFINDSFEVYYSYQNFNEIMIVSPNKDNEIRIMRLKDKKIIKILKGHSSSACHVRHFFNPKTKIDYLLSIDNDKTLNIWDLSNNFNLKQTLKLNYKHIFSAILIFDKNDYIITSTFSKDNLSEDFTKIFSFDSAKLIRNIPNTNINKTYYLLEWKNPNDEQCYIIDFCVGKILINNLCNEEIYAILRSKVRFEEELTYYRGCIIGNNNDHLCAISENGYIHQWNLINLELICTITIKNGQLNTLLKWSNRYIIVSDKKTNSYFIIDITAKYIISKVGKHIKDFIKSFKKIMHPIFGECLITCNHAHHIQLWTLIQNSNL